MFRPLPFDADAPTQSLIGVAALAAELATEGTGIASLFAGTGVFPTQLQDAEARISHRQRLAIYRNAQRLAKRSDIGLRAGARHRLSDFGIYGYAMTSSSTFGEALRFGFEHITLAGPVLQITYERRGPTATLRSHGAEALGDLLPFAAEFWRSSMTTLFSSILESPFPSRRMAFSFQAPAHWRSYERIFNCEVDFGARQMEWEFDADVLDRPCPGANPITAQVCQSLCDRLLIGEADDSPLVRQIRIACLNNASSMPTAQAMAAQLNMSLRTLHRRLADEGASYQSLINEVRKFLAIELLENTRLSMEQVAERVGFSDAASFRKAFRGWTSMAPSAYRRPLEF